MEKVDKFFFFLLKWNFFSFVGSEISLLTDSRYMPVQFAVKGNYHSCTLGSFFKLVLNVSERKMKGKMVYNVNQWTNHIRETSLFSRLVLNASERKMEEKMVYSANQWTNHIRKTSSTKNGIIRPVSHCGHA